MEFCVVVFLWLESQSPFKKYFRINQKNIIEEYSYMTVIIMQVGFSCYYLLHKNEAEVVKISCKVKNGKHWQSGKMLKFLHAKHHILVSTASHHHCLLKAH